MALAAAIPEPEATAESEPWYGYGYRGYGGYAGYYRPYGYGYWGRKRRSAEPNAVAAAEPTAEAQPEADAASHYGYHRGYYGGYGRRGHYGYYGRGRGLLSLLLQLSLALWLNLVTATALDTMVVTDIKDTTVTGKGLLSPLLWLNQLLMPSQRLLLTPTMDTAVAMEDTMEDTEEATMAGARKRGLQIPTTDTDIVVATTATVDTVEDTGAELNRLLILSLNFTLATFLIPLKPLIVTTYTA